METEPIESKLLGSGDNPTIATSLISHETNHHSPELKPIQLVASVGQQQVYFCSTWFGWVGFRLSPYLIQFNHWPNMKQCINSSFFIKKNYILISYYWGKFPDKSCLCKKSVLFYIFRIGFIYFTNIFYNTLNILVYIFKYNLLK